MTQRHNATFGLRGTEAIHALFRLMLVTIASNLAAIRERIAVPPHAPAATPRHRPDGRLQDQPAAGIIEAYHAGQRLFGENRVQEFADKFPLAHRTKRCQSST